MDRAIQQKKESFKKMRDIKIFRNMTEIPNDNGKKTILHHDDMITYNSWFLIQYHSVDSVIFRGKSKDIPEQYKSFLPKIGNPDYVIITSSDKDTY